MSFVAVERYRRQQPEIYYQLVSSSHITVNILFDRDEWSMICFVVVALKGNFM